MADLRLPARVRIEQRRPSSRSCPAHRAWVRKHHCCVPGCKRLPIECAHVRSGTDGGTALKPSDCRCISLRAHHHPEQHRLGEGRFERKYLISFTELARLFALRSPHWKNLPVGQ